MSQELYTPQQLQEAYELGRQRGHQLALAAGHEADISWRRTAEQSYQDRKTAMLRQFEECAHRFHERELGRPYVEFQGRQA